MNPSKKKDKNWVNTYILKSLANEIDKQVENGLFNSRQSAVDHYLRKGLEYTPDITFQKSLFEKLDVKLEKISKNLANLIKSNER